MTKPNPSQPPTKPKELERATGWVVQWREGKPNGEIVVLQAVTAYESDITWHFQQKVAKSQTATI